jgi:phosphatidylglycerophosphate synthase
VARCGHTRGSRPRETTAPDLASPIRRRPGGPVPQPTTFHPDLLRPSPNVLSLLSFSVGIAAAVFLATGEGLIGGVLAQACSILDGVDGEVARLTVGAGPRGALLDGFLDRLGDAALAGGLGLWAVETGTAPTTAVVLTAAAVTGSLLSMATKDRMASLGLWGPPERLLGWLMGGRDGRLLIIAVLAILERPILALAIVAGTSLLASLLRVAGARAPRL